MKAGYNGEYRVFQSLKSLPEKEYLLFHDLRLFGSPFPFQMDILILTSSFLLILEVKNMAGEIFKCSAFTMERKSKKWICRTCLDISLDAHISALYDYLFLAIQCKKLLLSLKLNHSGHTRGSVYLLNSLLEG
ncbi:nuclease-related domain-containing protein [Peribacillus simplex]|uniref:nuclease-related domain-containing protein n=1 Tax=Peribacillus simplex TaxID=1478 RepID=UPI003D29D3AF